MHIFCLHSIWEEVGFHFSVLTPMYTLDFLLNRAKIKIIRLCIAGPGL